MFWQIASFPKCSHHVFLSHCREDRDAIVGPVYEGLKAVGVEPWLDQTDYYYGRPSREALQDAILDSRHMVFFVSDAMLRPARGWCVLELAYAEILDANLTHRGGALASPFLPLFLVDQEDSRLPFTVWQSVRDRGRFFPAESPIPVAEWCCQQIRDYLGREEEKRKKLAESVKRDRQLKLEIDRVPGLLNRVTRFQPRRIQ